MATLHSRLVTELRQAMEQKEITQVELSRRTGLCLSAINRYCNGREYTYKLDIWDTLLAAVGVEVGFRHTQSKPLTDQRSA